MSEFTELDENDGRGITYTMRAPGGHVLQIAWNKDPGGLVTLWLAGHTNEAWDGPVQTFTRSMRPDVAVEVAEALLTAARSTKLAAKCATLGCACGCA